MPTIDNLVKRMESYLSDDQVADVVRAYQYAQRAHEGQMRASGEPYISHPLAVANILIDMHMDHQSLMAALLHDVIEDTGISAEELGKEFGDDVAVLVEGVSKIAHINFRTAKEKQAENLQKMMLAMTRDIRVILVKLADRLHNMRTLHVLPPEKRKRIARETLEIYAPIALRLGMNNFRVEYEDLGFNATYPMRANLIAKAVRNVRGNRREIMSTIREAIEKRLAEEAISARVIGREKHMYSIYQKMREKRRSFKDIMDVYGFRIIVDSVDNCYRTLGVVHNLYKPIPGKFKDYIAIPKTNGYQSLHTVLKGFSGVPIEIQVRTEEMEAMANNGIAAHWLYKSEDGKSPADARTHTWMQTLLEMQSQAGNSEEFIENVKVDLFPDEIFVFSPKGDIFELPRGSTPVDFAYAVHTNIGNHCVAARVDSRLAPLSSPLESGQTVEVITAKHAQPNANWLNYVVTGKARANIRHFLKNQRRSESVALGERLLEKALASFNVSFGDLPLELVVSELANSGYTELDDLLEQIGLGNRMAALVAQKLISGLNHNAQPVEQKPIKPVALKGTEGLLVTYGKCCYPLPGDPVIGHISAGKGLVVHRDQCSNLLAELRDNAEKCVPLHWESDIDAQYQSALRVEIHNRRGALASLAQVISECDSNIDSVQMAEKDASISIVHLVMKVRGRKHLANIIRRIRLNSVVERVVRIKA